jgi:hypothetical protein
MPKIFPFTTLYACMNWIKLHWGNNLDLRELHWGNKLDLRETGPIGHPDNIPNPRLVKLHNVLIICLGLAGLNAHVWEFYLLDVIYVL